MLRQGNIWPPRRHSGKSLRCRETPRLRVLPRTADFAPPGIHLCRPSLRFPKSIAVDQLLETKYSNRMVDTLSPEARSERMSRIRGKHTVPELVVRRLLHGLGYRFRLHRKGLPGSPDLVFPGRKKVVFVHGCYWHGHECKWGRLPKSNIEFWQDKVARNQARDARNLTDLAAAGWSAFVVWQCQTKDPPALAKVLKRFLGKPRRNRGRPAQRIK
jgi:DNA mismatch endonuclease (patch repair protein)